MKTVTVIAADEQPGYSVASVLATRPGYAVCGLVSVATGERLRELKKAGVAIFTGTVDHLDELRNALNGANCCFAWTKTDFNRPHPIAFEVQQGKNIALACRDCRVDHVIYCTQLNTRTAIGIVARHMVSKSNVEKFMKDQQLPMTSLILPVLYEDLFDSLKPTTENGSHNHLLSIPMGDVPLDLIAVEDIGHVVAAIFDRSDQYLHKTISCAGDKITLREICETLSRYLVPFEIRDAQITTTQYAQRCRNDARDMAAMFEFFMRVDQKYNVNSTKLMFPGLQSLAQWAKLNVAKLSAILRETQ